MKRETRKKFSVGAGLLAGFVLWTLAVCFVDVRAIGPEQSAVGFATVNGFVHNLTGVHMLLYVITDWLGLIPFCFVPGFAILGLVQWIKRKSFMKVDFSILVLGGFYLVVMAVYVLFEVLVINYRPVLINGVLEASYPSSTTMLVMTVMPTALMQFNARIKSHTLRRCVAFAIVAFVAFMVIGRLLSGVHWLTDIIGGAILSAGLVTMYYAVSNLGKS
ncbi:MAG: phosphatase PAP2 family protein [Clostridia bacterium]|nr:phosphatase PAP2 family protein [Clostridia bacterium]